MVVTTLLLGFAFIVGFGAGGTVAERALADARRELARKRHEFWLEQQDSWDAEQAEAEIRRLRERAERLSRPASGGGEHRPADDADHDSTDKPPPAQPAA